MDPVPQIYTLVYNYSPEPPDTAALKAAALTQGHSHKDQAHYNTYLNLWENPQGSSTVQGNNKNQKTKTHNVQAYSLSSVKKAKSSYVHRIFREDELNTGRNWWISEEIFSIFLFSVEVRLITILYIIRFPSRSHVPDLLLGF